MRKRQFRAGGGLRPWRQRRCDRAVFNKIGADIIALNATRDPTRYSRTADEFERDMQVLASITGTLKADLGVRIDTAASAFTS